MSKQYRTLRDGDVRLEGYECRAIGRGATDIDSQWTPGGAVGVVITPLASTWWECRVPCSATVAPDGYEIIDRSRLPKGTRVGGTWMRWNATATYRGAWVTLSGGWLLPVDSRIILAAPADELAALYAQGDAEREQPAPASPCACCAEAMMLVDAAIEDRDYFEREREAMQAERDEARAKMADARRGWDAAAKDRDAARAEVERLRDRVTAARAALEGRDD